MLHDDHPDLGSVTKPRRVSAPGELQVYEVTAVNSDGTIQARNLYSRARKDRVPVVSWYAPQVGERVFVVDRDGVAQQPVCTGPFTSRTGGGRPNAAFNRVGFNGVAPIAKPTVTGSKGGNAALASLLAAVAAYGLIVDSTT